jgi:hypothetical protein
LAAIEADSTILARVWKPKQWTIATALSLEQGILFFDRRFYLPDASPLLPDLLESL